MTGVRKLVKAIDEDNDEMQKEAVTELAEHVLGLFERLVKAAEDIATHVSCIEMNTRK